MLYRVYESVILRDDRNTQKLADEVRRRKRHVLDPSAADFIELLVRLTDQNPCPDRFPRGFMSAILNRIYEIGFQGVCDSVKSDLTTVESHWWRHGFPTVFVENEDVISLVQRADFNIHADAFRVPFPGGSVAFAFPKDFRIDGRIVEGALFTLATRDDLLQDIFAVFNAAVKQKLLPRETVDSIRRIIVTSDAVKIFHSAGIDGPVASLFYPAGCGQSRAMHRLWVGKNDFVTDLNDIERFRKFVNTHKVPGPYDRRGYLHREEGLNEDDLQFQHKLSRLCAGLCVYACAFPDAVRDGFPERFGVVNKQANGPKSKAVFHVIAPEVIRTPVKMHLRRGHFRSLHHERYQRDRYGHIRIVWVSPTVVGGRLSVSTLTRPRKGVEAAA